MNMGDQVIGEILCDFPELSVELRYLLKLGIASPLFIMTLWRIMHFQFHYTQNLYFQKLRSPSELFFLFKRFLLTYSHIIKLFYERK